ncbi:MAG: hypothetical protein KDB27_00690 [Planctomycetales bacterium]|nr:hypothetical protein [Planctomycetales bacterium]
MIREHLRDWSNSDKDYQLVEARILGNAQVKDLANQFETTYAAARSKIHRARKYLGIVDSQ